MILALDTSLPLLSVALLRGEVTLGAVAVRGEGSRNEKLLPLIDVLLGEANVALADLTLVAVTRGPGSFTGTRIGLATAQGIALGRELPIIAMSTHEAAAWSAPRRRTIVSSDAGRGERYVSAFAEEPIFSEKLMSVSDLESVAKDFDHHLDLDSAAERMNIALFLGAKAAWLDARGRLAEYASTTPIYVRLAEAEVRLQEKQ